MFVLLVRDLNVGGFAHRLDSRLVSEGRTRREGKGREDGSQRRGTRSNRGGVFPSEEGSRNGRAQLSFLPRLGCWGQVELSLQKYIYIAERGAKKNEHERDEISREGAKDGDATRFGLVS